MSATAATTATIIRPELATRLVGAMLVLLGIAAIIMPDRLPAIVAAPLAGGDAIAAAINNGIDAFVSVFKPTLHAAVTEDCVPPSPARRLLPARLV